MPEPKLCTDCKWCDTGNGRLHDWGCYVPYPDGTPNLLDGTTKRINGLRCDLLRETETMCGPEGQWFTPTNSGNKA